MLLQPSFNSSMSYYLCKDQIDDSGFKNEEHDNDSKNAELNNNNHDRFINLKELIHEKIATKNEDGKEKIDFYGCGNYIPSYIDEKKPWKTDVHYFNKVYISSLALMKMAIHAESGGNIEVMGMMTGKITNNGFVIMDTYSLPVIGTETRVNAQSESYEYMASYLDSLKKLGYRNENIVGWYHSHPGYGCWLSGIDVSTESLNQTHQDPYLAVVIDPKQTKSKGKVEIGAFRTYPEGYNNDSNKRKYDDAQLIPNQKLKDYGVHSSRYYALAIEVFKTNEEEALLRSLSNNYWISSITGVQKDDYDDGVEDNTRIKANKLKVITEADKFVKTFDEKTARVFTLWKSDDNYINVHDNVKNINDNKQIGESDSNEKNKITRSIVCVPKEQRFETLCKSGIISHETGEPEKLNETLEILNADQSDYSEDIELELDDTDRVNELGTVDNQRRNIHIFSNDYEDIIMSNTESPGEEEEEEEDYGSIDSDTSNDNASTTSVSSRRTIERSKKPLSMNSIKQLSTGNKYRLLNISGKSSSSSLSLFSNYNEKGSNNGSMVDNNNIPKLPKKMHKRISKNDSIPTISMTNGSAKNTNTTGFEKSPLEKIGKRDVAMISNITKVVREIAAENLKNSISKRIARQLLSDTN